jgi:hypothetical protein
MLRLAAFRNRPSNVISPCPLKSWTVFCAFFRAATVSEPPGRYASSLSPRRLAPFWMLAVGAFRLPGRSRPKQIVGKPLKWRDGFPGLRRVLPDLIDRRFIPPRKAGCTLLDGLGRRPGRMFISGLPRVLLPASVLEARGPFISAKAAKARLALTFRNLASAQEHQPGAPEPPEKHCHTEYSPHLIALNLRPLPCTNKGQEGRTLNENEIAGDDALGWGGDVCANPILNRHRLRRTRRRVLPAASFLRIQHPAMSGPRLHLG